MNSSSNSQIEEHRARERGAVQLRENAESSSDAQSLHDNGHGPATPPLLLRANVGQRGVASLRAAAMQGAQRTYGNRAVQRFLSQQTYGGEVESDDLAKRIDSKSGGGSPLPTGLLARLGEGLGADLSGVRVHTDVEADKMARSVKSIAFTTGQDIFFSSGAYSPGSSDGLRLLAHEATHTVQQSEGAVEGTPTEMGVSVSDPSDSFEQEAERTADLVMSGQAGNLSGQAIASNHTDSSAAPAVQRYRSPDWDWAKNTIDSGMSGAFGLLGATPILGNVMNAGLGGMYMANSGIASVTGDEANAKRYYHGAQNSFLNAIPGFGNIRSGAQGLHDQNNFYQNLFGGGSKPPESSFDIYNRESAPKLDSFLSSLF